MGWLSGSFKVGDRVRICAPIALLDHRKNRNGVIEHVDGAYIYVRPMWCWWTAELYACELEAL